MIEYAIFLFLALIQTYRVWWEKSSNLSLTYFWYELFMRSGLSRKKKCNLTLNNIKIKWDYLLLVQFNAFLQYSFYTDNVHYFKEAVSNMQNKTVHCINIIQRLNCYFRLWHSRFHYNNYKSLNNIKLAKTKCTEKDGKLFLSFGKNKCFNIVWMLKFLFISVSIRYIQ